MALLTPVSIVPAELCEDVFYLLLCAGNLVPEDLEESCEEPVRRTQIYQSQTSDAKPTDRRVDKLRTRDRAM